MTVYHNPDYCELYRRKCYESGTIVPPVSAERGQSVAIVIESACKVHIFMNDV